MKKGYHPCVPGQCRTLWPVQDSACGSTVWVDVLKPVSWRAVCMPFRPVVPELTHGLPGSGGPECPFLSHGSPLFFLFQFQLNSLSNQ